MIRTCRIRPDDPGARSREVPVRRPESSSGRLPPEWLNAIRGAQTGASPGPPVSGESGNQGESGGSSPYGHSLELRLLVGRLKCERIARGQSLSDIARITQQARSAISRLENGQYHNPTVNTLFRYARALGVHIRFLAEPLSAEELARDAEADPGRA